ncbi:MAG: GPP34 family phosphoprotein [Actinobacteria bacterium]|nr:GPP34 family phosphoprotein [Actinomycetota bacterium]
MTGMDFLCDDLLLLAIDACQGRLGRVYAISYGLMGAELVRLAATGRITIAEDRVLVCRATPTGDAELDAALARINELASPPQPGDWVARPRLGIVAGYLHRLEAARVIQDQTRWWLARYRVTDAARAAQARQQLDAIARSAGPVDLGQAAYAGLACAIGLDRMLYRGRRRGAERRRLRDIASGHWMASLPGADDSVTTGPAASQAALQATMAQSARKADEAQRMATQAAVGAASLAAIDAATRAAVHAANLAVAHATAATAHGGTAGGHSGGGHGGH